MSSQVSIIMPVLNGAKYLHEAVDSIVNQTLRDIELIVVDSGSSDGTLDILNEYKQKDSRVRILHCNKRSMGAQYNAGLDVAQSEFVGFAEADDAAKPDMYEKLLNTILKHKTDYVKADFEFFIDLPIDRITVRHSVLGNYRSYYGKVISPFEISDFADIDKYIWHGLYHRKFLNTGHIRFQETDGAAFQDAGFVFQILSRAKSAYYINTSLYKYRRDNPGSSGKAADSYKYAMNEFDFALRNLTEHQAAYSMFLPKLLRKFYILFYDCICNFLSHHEYSDSLSSKTVFFREKLESIYSSMPFAELWRTGLWPPQDIALMFDDFKNYCLTVQNKRNKLAASLHFMIAEMKRADSIVICATGEQSEIMYGYLRRNGIDSVKTFMALAENNPSISNSIPLEETVVQWPNAFYLLTSGGMEDIVMKNRLIRSGIGLNQIYAAGQGLNAHNWSELTTIN